jgi:hypothetical protein
MSGPTQTRDGLPRAAPYRFSACKGTKFVSVSLPRGRGAAAGGAGAELLVVDQPAELLERPAHVP